jgi:hypothetical protein
MKNIEFEYFFDDVESCECIGMFEDEYVYDIEIDDDTHTFIANDILVHNSLYISFKPLMESVGYKGDELKFILYINLLFVKHLFNDYLEQYSNIYKVKNLHDFELETINKSGLHIQKKNYVNLVVYEDGIFHEDNAHYFSKGVEIVKSSTPKFVRENIWDFINYIFNNPNANIRDILSIMKNLKKQFLLADIEDISMTTNLSNYSNKVLEDQSEIKTVKGAHFSVKAAALHNYLLNKNSSYKTKYDLLKGGRIKFYYCNHPLNERFAYLRSFHPSEITQKEKVIVDYDLLFYKTMITIVNRFLDPIGLPIINKRLSVLNSLFDFKKEPKEKEIDEIEDEFSDLDDLIIKNDDDFLRL